MALQERGAGPARSVTTLVHCPSCESRKPMMVKELVLRPSGDKIVYRCVECVAEVTLPAK